MAALLTTGRNPVNALDVRIEPLLSIYPLLRGTISLQSQTASPVVRQEGRSTPALYVTVRPDLQSTAVVPPVLSAKFPLSTTTVGTDSFLPYEYSLSVENLTPEGAFGAITSSALSDDTRTIQIDMEKLWWKDENLIVNVRYDTDGIASTRDENDLVGRGYYSRSKGNHDDSQVMANIELVGRGLGGKFAVTSSNKFK